MTALLIGYGRYPGMRHFRRRPVSVTSDSFPRVVDEKERSCLVSHDSDGADDRGELLRGTPTVVGQTRTERHCCARAAHQTFGRLSGLGACGRLRLPRWRVLLVGR